MPSSYFPHQSLHNGCAVVFCISTCSIMPVMPLILFGQLRSPPIKTPILRIKTPILRILILRNSHYRKMRCTSSLRTPPPPYENN